MNANLALNNPTLFAERTYFITICIITLTGKLNAMDHTMENWVTGDRQNALKSSHEYFYWYDTYPLEFGEFLLDSALARGVYYHTMAANDAFYERCTY